MGITKKTVHPGDGKSRPVKGDQVTMEYRGCLFDASQGEKNNYMGREFDSSQKRGEFKTPIGVGKVIRGWDEGVMDMSLGEKSILTISSDYAYGDRGFPGLIPANATLVL
ncbi:hypothetical protein FQN57_006537 [Myotisia sp. PD_48]|nr:hypothetical protein FQN57_006537 [Myotisia sp. PD_48]